MGGGGEEYSTDCTWLLFADSEAVPQQRSGGCRDHPCCPGWRRSLYATGRDARGRSGVVIWVRTQDAEERDGCGSVVELREGAENFEI